MRIRLPVILKVSLIRIRKEVAVRIERRFRIAERVAQYEVGGRISCKVSIERKRPLRIDIAAVELLQPHDFEARLESMISGYMRKVVFPLEHIVRVRIQCAYAYVAKACDCNVRRRVEQV